jgi:hypothetical protein
MFGLKGEEVTRGWGRVQNEELYNMWACSLPDIIGVICLGG